MEEIEYKKNFEKLKEFQEKQTRQKLRGLNDYNMVNVVRKASEEVGMHSNVIYSLLNTNGLHYQNDLFLNLFIEKVLGFTIEDFGKIFSVNVEEQTDKNRRIDFTIKSKNYFIGIEMKINAKDLKNQIFHYNEYLKKEADTQTVLMYYLTKDGKDACQNSKNTVDIKRVSFEKHILNWLDACQNEVKNITNLNVALEDYKNIVNKITNKYQGNIMSLSEYIQEDESIYKMALEIQDTLPVVRKKIIDDFFDKIINSLQLKLGSEWTVELKGELAKRWEYPLRIYKTSWMGINKKNLIFGFEFNKKDYFVGAFGIVRTDSSIDIKGSIIEKFKIKLNELDCELDTSDWWLHWEYLPNIKGSDDLATYIMFNKKNAEEKIIEEIIALIDIFEIKSNLVTEINDYLNRSEEQ